MKGECEYKQSHTILIHHLKYVYLGVGYKSII